MEKYFRAKKIAVKCLRKNWEGMLRFKKMFEIKMQIKCTK